METQTIGVEVELQVYNPLVRHILIEVLYQHKLSVE